MRSNECSNLPFAGRCLSDNLWFASPPTPSYAKRGRLPIPPPNVEPVLSAVEWKGVRGRYCLLLINYFSSIPTFGLWLAIDCAIPNAIKIDNTELLP